MSLAMNSVNARCRRLLDFGLKIAMGTSLLLNASGLRAQQADGKNKERIGTYDSRSIAVAYAGSPLHERYLQELRERRRRAVEDQNQKEVSRCDQEGRDLQKKLHIQGFSTAPVDDLLALIQEKLAAVKKEAEVSVLISKWNAAELAKHPNAEQVDVTIKLVDLFEPKSRQRQAAISIQERKPIPADRLEKIKD